MGPQGYISMNRNQNATTFKEGMNLKMSSATRHACVKCPLVLFTSEKGHLHNWTFLQPGKRKTNRTFVQWRIVDFVPVSGSFLPGCQNVGRTNTRIYKCLGAQMPVFEQPIAQMSGCRNVSGVQLPIVQLSIIKLSAVANCTCVRCTCVRAWFINLHTPSLLCWYRGNRASDRMPVN